MPFAPSNRYLRGLIASFHNDEAWWLGQFEWTATTPLRNWITSGLCLQLSWCGSVNWTDWRILEMHSSDLNNEPSLNWSFVIKFCQTAMQYDWASETLFSKYFIFYQNLLWFDAWNFILPLSEQIVVVNLDSLRRPTSSSGIDRIFISSGIWELPNREKKSFVLLSLRRLLKEEWGKVPSVPITPLASSNSSSLFFSTLMLISPFRGLILRTVTSRESWMMIDRNFCIMFLYAFCDITEKNNFALDRISFYTFDLTREFLFLPLSILMPR